MKTNTSNSLKGFQYYYEEMEYKVPRTARTSDIKTTKKTPTPKQVVKPQRFSKFADLKSKISNRKPKSKKPSSLSKKAQLEQKRARQSQVFRGIIGIGLLLVVVSITRSTFVTLEFVDGFANVFYLIPQVIFAVVVSVTVFILAFLKINK